MRQYCEQLTKKYQELVKYKGGFDLVYLNGLKVGSMSEATSAMKVVKQKINYLKESLGSPCSILKCFPEQIAHSQAEITEHTKAYIGPLFSNIFKILSDCKHIYTEFPDGEFTKEIIVTGGKTTQELTDEMLAKGIEVNRTAQTLIDHVKFITFHGPQPTEFVSFKLSSLFDSKKPTSGEVIVIAKELGLELCNAQDGVYYRLQYDDQPVGECRYVISKNFYDPNAGSTNFFLGCDSNNAKWISDGFAGPAHQWPLDSVFVFRVGKDETK